MRSSAAIRGSCATSSAICCSRSCSTRAWPQERGWFDFAARRRRDSRQAGAPASARVRQAQALPVSQEQTRTWEELKARERARGYRSAARAADAGALADVPRRCRR